MAEGIRNTTCCATKEWANPPEIKEALIRKQSRMQPRLCDVLCWNLLSVSSVAFPHLRQPVDSVPYVFRNILIDVVSSVSNASFTTPSN